MNNPEEPIPNQEGELAEDPIIIEERAAAEAHDTAMEAALLDEEPANNTAETRRLLQLLEESLAVQRRLTEQVQQLQAISPQPQPLMEVPVSLPPNIQPAPQETVMRFRLGDAFVEVAQMPVRRGRWRRPTPYQRGNNRRGNR
ncbi:hypothetical protein GE061_001338 [Apolygus lucorum]|uniref:Uncharacterized protein n=1 Tax=Apolygus lucorum TaxID=248454 RepID=A0A6A4K014_APOLU|nr:hypothetical protein GE061_001338 [Apolygus lucorum]